MPLPIDWRQPAVLPVTPVSLAVLPRPSPHVCVGRLRRPAPEGARSADRRSGKWAAAAAQREDWLVRTGSDSHVLYGPDSAAPGRRPSRAPCAAHVARQPRGRGRPDLAPRREGACARPRQPVGRRSPVYAIQGPTGLLVRLCRVERGVSQLSLKRCPAERSPRLAALRTASWDWRRGHGRPRQVHVPQGVRAARSPAAAGRPGLLLFQVRAGHRRLRPQVLVPPGGLRVVPGPGGGRAGHGQPNTHDCR